MAVSKQVTIDPYLLHLPPPVTRENVDRVKGLVYKSYENQIKELTEENYDNADPLPLDLRISVELKKKLDKEFKTNWSVVVGRRFGASLGLLEEPLNHSFIFEDKTKNGMSLFTMVFESNVKHVPFAL